MTAATILAGVIAALSLQGSVPEDGATASARVAVGAVNSVCLAIAAGQTPSPDVSHTPRRRAFLAANGFSEIIPQDALRNLGQLSIGISDSEVLGYRRVGRDDVFLAMGGSRIQSCRVAIGTPSLTMSNGQALNVAIAETQTWSGNGMGADHGPIRISRFKHQSASGPNARLSVITGQRNLIRNLIVMIVDSENIHSSR